MTKFSITAGIVVLGVTALSPVPLWMMEKLARIDKKGLER